MKRKEVIKIIIEETDPDAAVISSTGLISRELFNYKDAPRNFYMVGSMGLVSSIGLGVALNKPRRKIVVIDGDGSLLMNLGTLVTIGYFKPSNLIHVVLDNEAYDSCGGEKSFSKDVALEKIARETGYVTTRKITDPTKLRKALERNTKLRGPVFLLVKIKPGGARHLPRPMKLKEVAARFKKFLSSD